MNYWQITIAFSFSRIFIIYLTVCARIHWSLRSATLWSADCTLMRTARSSLKDYRPFLRLNSVVVYWERCWAKWYIHSTAGLVAPSDPVEHITWPISHPNKGKKSIWIHLICSLLIDNRQLKCVLITFYLEVISNNYYYSTRQLLFELYMHVLY